jgi:hypothetical protein
MIINESDMDSCYAEINEYFDEINL